MNSYQVPQNGALRSNASSIGDLVRYRMASDRMVRVLEIPSVEANGSREKGATSNGHSNGHSNGQELLETVHITAVRQPATLRTKNGATEVLEALEARLLDSPYVQTTAPVYAGNPIPSVTQSRWRVLWLSGLVIALLLSIFIPALDYALTPGPSSSPAVLASAPLTKALPTASAGDPRTALNNKPPDSSSVSNDDPPSAEITIHRETGADGKQVLPPGPVEMSIGNSDGTRSHMRLLFQPGNQQNGFTPSLRVLIDGDAPHQVIEYIKFGDLLWLCAPDGQCRASAQQPSPVPVTDAHDDKPVYK